MCVQVPLADGAATMAAYKEWEAGKGKVRRTVWLCCCGRGCCCGAAVAGVLLAEACFPKSQHTVYLSATSSAQQAGTSHSTPA